MDQLVDLAAILQEDWSTTQLSLMGGGIIGLIAGFALERSDFCTRSAMTTLLEGSWRKDATLVMNVLVAMLTALVLLALVEMAGLDLVAQSSSHEDALRVGGILIGATVFGVGMTLSRSCISRMLILAARGNARALINMVFMAVAAWAAISGVLATPRLEIATFLSVEPGINNSLPVAIGFAAVLLALLWFFGQRLPKGRAYARLAWSMVIGALVPASFIVTGVFGSDPFDPVPVEGLRYIQPVTDSLAYVVYADALPIRFGVGLTAGTLVGAVVSALLAGRVRIEGFDGAPHPLRYIAGAIMMGFSGVIAGGCTMNWMVTNTAAGHLGVPLAATGLLGGMYIGRRVFKAF